MKLNVVIGETEVTLGSDDLEYVSQNIILSYVHAGVSFSYTKWNRSVHMIEASTARGIGGGIPAEGDVVSHVVVQFSLYHQRHP
jgi:hypothetical protein